TSSCIPVCHTATDCTAAVRGAANSIPECDNNPLGCQCDNGTCEIALCSGDVDCALGQVCRSGKCVNARASTDAVRCQLVPDFALLRGSHAAHFSVLAFDNDGVPLVVPATWAAASGDVTLVDAGFFVAASTPSIIGVEPLVQANVGSATCSA